MSLRADGDWIVRIESALVRNACLKFASLFIVCSIDWIIDTALFLRLRDRASVAISAAPRTKGPCAGAGIQGEMDSAAIVKESVGLEASSRIRFVCSIAVWSAEICC